MRVSLLGLEWRAGALSLRDEYFYLSRSKLLLLDFFSLVQLHSNQGVLCRNIGQEHGSNVIYWKRATQIVPKIMEKMAKQ